MNSESHLKSIVELLLPPDMFNYFEIIKTDIKEKEIHIYLDELNINPDDFSKENLMSKGFHPEATIQDFPVRDKAMFLHVRRRRWLVKSSGKVVSRDWNTVAKGTSLTKGFATFLKGVFG